MLGVSFDQVGKRIARRGRHNLPFPMGATAADIAYSFRRAIYAECEEGKPFFGMPVRQFTEAISSNHVQWVSDEEFDDSSYVLQFEDENQVRLVAFTGTPDFRYDPASLRDVCLSLDEFYGILQEWRDRFKDDWTSFTKVSSSIQGCCPKVETRRHPLGSWLRSLERLWRGWHLRGPSAAGFVLRSG